MTFQTTRSTLTIFFSLSLEFKLLCIRSKEVNKENVETWKQFSCAKRSTNIHHEFRLSLIFHKHELRNIYIYLFISRNGCAYPIILYMCTYIFVSIAQYSLVKGTFLNWSKLIRTVQKLFRCDSSVSFKL